MDIYTPTKADDAGGPMVPLGATSLVHHQQLLAQISGCETQVDTRMMSSRDTPLYMSCSWSSHCGWSNRDTTTINGGYRWTKGDTPPSILLIVLTKSLNLLTSFRFRKE
ncbi:hypothetical protein Nepgr_022312 [Nepenthes gracilis]|uniref:Uncharacterized protein n=1 Tax=Nepenthes gracilis TaxID=150966 RepID=A0AAD3T0L2_NEPGR|nr:hypothetical protein Nepgr_022312 [Nepenthes gracilis]